MTETYIYDYVRTPFGRFGKGLAATRPDDLGAVVLGEIVRRNPALDVSAIDDVFYGAANQSGEDNRNVARMAALLAGYPTSIPGVTVNHSVDQAWRPPSRPVAPSPWATSTWPSREAPNR